MGCIVSSNSSNQTEVHYQREPDDNLQLDAPLHSSMILIEDGDQVEAAYATETDIIKENVTQPETEMPLETIAVLERSTSRHKNDTHFIHPAALAKGPAESIDAAYPFNGRGFVLLINYSLNREGSEKDVIKLVKFFRDELGFYIEIGKDNMTRNDLRKCLEDTREKIDKRFYCFICIVMAHGNETGIMTSDDKVQPYNEIIETFDNRSMQKFAGRPKVFFINACRGERLQRIIAVDHVSTTETDAAPVPPPILVAETSDIYAVYSTVTGFASTRDAQEGSIFIQSCVDVFQKYYTKRNICEMTTAIRRKIQEKHTCQVSEVKTTLTKQFYLMKSANSDRRLQLNVVNEID